MSKFHLLVDKFIDSSISQEEREVLERWIQENENNMAFFKSRLKESNRMILADFDTDSAYLRFLETLKSRKKTSRSFHPMLKYAAILILLLTVGFFAKRQLFDHSPQTSIKVVENHEEMDLGNDIVVKLADGTTKVLSPDGKEEVTDAQGGIVARKEEHTITFDKAKEETGNSTRYHEIFIPFGRTFQMKLSDGTRVWLNAGSKLRFPQSFVNSDKNRIVYLEGEAFFNVVKNKDKPFIVNTREIDVEVLGTQFNISSYDTDDYIATTLVEGAVKVYETRTPENGILLSPNFQTNYNKFANHFNKAEVDTDVYTAWMQGRLVIDNLKFSEILVRLERRYFVKFVNRAEHLNDEIYKGEFVDEDIESVLKTIALSTSFNYEINQNIITITQ